MRRKSYHTPWWLWAVSGFLFLSAGFSLGLKGIGNEMVYFIFLNIISISYTLVGVVAVIAARKHLKLFPVLLMTGNYILSFGQLYFLDFRLYHRLLSILLIVSILYLLCYLTWFSVIKKKKLEQENLHLLNPILPVVVVAGSALIKMMWVFWQIETEMGSFRLTCLLVALGCAAVALIAALLCIKDRRNKGEYFGKLMAVFSVTLILVFAMPALTAEYTNYVWDNSRGERTECVVIDRYTATGGKGGSIYHLVLRADGQEVDLVTMRVVYAQYEPGDTIYLYRHEGLLGYSYYEYCLDFIFRYGELK